MRCAPSRLVFAVVVPNQDGRDRWLCARDGPLDEGQDADSLEGTAWMRMR